MKNVILISFLSLFLSSCAQESKGVKEISLQEFVKLYPEKTKALIDVRTQREFEAGHISGAVMIDVFSDDFVTQVTEKYQNKSEPLYLYCRSGMRSMRAAKLLEKAGFKEIYSLEGGYLKWKKNN